MVGRDAACAPKGKADEKRKASTLFPTPDECSMLCEGDSRQSKRTRETSNSVCSAAATTSEQSLNISKQKGRMVGAESVVSRPSRSVCSVATSDHQEPYGEECFLAKKEKAVKQKKTCLRVLKRIMDIPQNSPLLRVWRDAHTAKKTGKEISAGYYGIEVMDVEEVDNTLQTLVPHINVGLIGSQTPQVTTAGILGISPEIASKCVVMQKGRYHLKVEHFPAEARHMMRMLKQRAKQLHHEAEEKRLRSRGLSTAEGAIEHFNLRCFACQGDLSCSCPIAVRRSLQQSTGDIEEEASMIALLGCTFQEIWQRIGQLEPETIHTMVTKTCNLLACVVDDVEIKSKKLQYSPDSAETEGQT